MELEKELSNINNELNKLLMRKRSIQDKILKYRLFKMFNINVEINDYLLAPNESNVNIYINEFNLDINIVKHYNIIYYKCIVNEKNIYKFTNESGDYKKINEFFPRFKEIFIDEIYTWFYFT